MKYEIHYPIKIVIEFLVVRKLWMQYYARAIESSLKWFFSE